MGGGFIYLFLERVPVTADARTPRAAERLSYALIVVLVDVAHDTLTEDDHDMYASLRFPCALDPPLR